MKKPVIAPLVVVLVGGAMLLMSTAQNGGCHAWQDSVGTQGSPFSGTEDHVVCR